MGNTSACPGSPRPKSVHPHGRGEHKEPAEIEGSPSGSSPRAWGTRCASRQGVAILRFIPTGVGNTRSVRTSRQSTPVHPHGRGEHYGISMPRSRTTGSSPRAWGTRRVVYYLWKGVRFIPTGVGNTIAISRVSSLMAVHPHGRGEHRLPSHVEPFLSGSSPRAWGTREFHPQHQVDHRFIPTGVGNTMPWPASPTPYAVHPHGRGEHYAVACLTHTLRGSSPRAWGTLIPARIAPPIGRFIPTGVGNTDRGHRRQGRVPVHPHGRGEHVPHISVSYSFGGSSPRAWGTQRFR